MMTGDSVTDCGRTRPSQEGYEHLGGGYPALLAARLQVAYPTQHFRILNSGVSGHRSKELLARWQSEVLAFEPQVLSILIGINDVWRYYDQPAIEGGQVDEKQYKENLEKMLQEAFAQPSLRSLILLTPFFLDANLQDDMRQRCERYADIVRTVAQQDKRIYLVDLAERFDAICHESHYMQWARDRVHPNLAGHQVIADELFHCLSEMN